MRHTPKPWQDRYTAGSSMEAAMLAEIAELRTVLSGQQNKANDPPPLPDPGFSYESVHSQGTLHYYTADQMRAYARVAISDAKKQKMEWISVADRLPDTDDEVLIVIRGSQENYVQTAHFIRGKWCRVDDEGPYPTLFGNQITHWMPFPPPPRDRPSKEE